MRETLITGAIEIITQFVSSYRPGDEGQAKDIAEVEARYNAFLEALRIEQQTIIQYFEMRFTERAEALRNFFDLMESASEHGDNTQLEFAVQGIIGIIRENPLLGFEEFRKALGDPTKIIEL